MIRTIVTWLLVLALGAAVVYGIVAGYEFWRDGKVEEGKTLGRAEIQKLWDEDRAKAQAAAIEDAQRNAAETDRRLKAQEANQHAQDELLAAARRDAAGAHAAVDRLQLRAAAYLDAAGCSNLSGDSAVACLKQAAAAVADALGRSAEIARRVAADADEARARGLKCEADFDALTLKATQPQGDRP